MGFIQLQVKFVFGPESAYYLIVSVFIGRPVIINY